MDLQTYIDIEFGFNVWARDGNCQGLRRSVPRLMSPPDKVEVRKASLHQISRFIVQYLFCGLLSPPNEAVNKAFIRPVSNVKSSSRFHSKVRSL